jgi:hypothetical protein
MKMREKGDPCSVCLVPMARASETIPPREKPNDLSDEGI